MFKRMRILSLLLAVSMLVAMLPTFTLTTSAATATKQLYVDENYNGSTPDGSPGNPYKSIHDVFEVIGNDNIEIAEIILLSDVSYYSYNVSAIVGENKTITIKSENGTLRTFSNEANHYNSMWHLTGGSHINLILENVIFEWADRGPIPNWGDFFIGDGNTLTLGDGAILNGSDVENRAINIRKGGTVIMLPGSKISGFIAGTNPGYHGDGYTGTDNAGGAVYVSPGGTFDMRGGEISGNRASVGAAGVYGESGSYILMSGAPVVKNNFNGAAQSNVFLGVMAGDEQLIHLTGAMSSGANVHVYVQNMPFGKGAKRNIVEGSGGYTATVTDSVYFHSDKSTEAGIIFDTDNIIKLSYDARLGTNVSAKIEGTTATITINPTSEAFKYAVVDGTGEVVGGAGGWKEGTGGAIEFTGLSPDTDYEIVRVPISIDNPATSGLENTGTPIRTPSTSFVDVLPKDIVRISDNKEIRIDPTKNGQEYAIYDLETDEIVGTWTDGNGGAITFPGLDPNKPYKVLTREPGTSGTPGTPSSVPGTGVIMPKIISDIDVTNGSGKITVDPTDDSKTYVLVDSVGNVVSTSPGNGDAITFGNLNPGETYKVHVVDNGLTGIHVGQPLPSPLDTESLIAESKIPVVGVNSSAKIEDGSATITVNPTSEAVKYAVVDGTGEVVGGAGGWKEGTGGAIEFTGLLPNTEYEIVAVPISEASPDISGLQGTGTPVMTPSTSFVDVRPSDVVRSVDNTGITINPTKGGQQYAIYDPATGELVGTWTDGNGAAINFPGLDPNKPYKVVTRESGTPPSMPGTGVTAAVRSSGGGGGGGVPSIPSTPGIQTSVNGKDVTFAVDTTSTSEDRDITSVQVDLGKLDEILTQGQGQDLAIHSPNDGDMKIDGLTAAAVKQLSDANSTLAISNPLAIYPVPSQQLDLNAVSKQLNSADLSDITVHIDIVHSSDALINKAKSQATAEGYELLVTPVDLNLTFSNDGKTIGTEQLNGYAKKYIALPDGIDPNRITTGVIVNPDGSVFHVPTVVTRIDNRYYALINDLHSSGTYSVIWNPQDFADVKGHWAHADINNIAARLDLAGTGNNTFSPNRNVTRAEFSEIVVTGLGLMRQDAPQNNFLDVPSYAWYRVSVAIATEFNIVSGYDDGNFRGDQQITREQGMAMIARAYNLINPQAALSVDQINSQLAQYKDGAKVSAWAEANVAQLLATGIVQGNAPALLSPQANMTRAEVAALIARLLKTTDLIDQ